MHAGARLLAADLRLLTRVVVMVLEGDVVVIVDSA
jgi:hypothetical protein